jgi:hypothetical protein
LHVLYCSIKQDVPVVVTGMIRPFMLCPHMFNPCMIHPHTLYPGALCPRTLHPGAFMSTYVISWRFYVPVRFIPEVGDHIQG